MNSFLNPLGPVAAAQGHHFLVVTALVMIAGLPVLIGTPLIYWRYRRGGKGSYRPEWEFSRPLELAMWGIPLVIVLILGTLLWQDSHRYAPERALGPAPTRVEAVGLNWKWLFLYPGQKVASVGELVLPADQAVELKLTSDTVMQSFMVPSLAGQLYAMPGMVTRLNLATAEPAETQGRNMQFNGTGFAGEGFRVRILSPQAYRQWLAAARGSGPVLDEASYRRLAAPGTVAQAAAGFDSVHAGSGGPFTMRLADSDFFAGIVARYHTGQPLPVASQPGSEAYGQREAAQ